MNQEIVKFRCSFELKSILYKQPYIKNHILFQIIGCELKTNEKVNVEVNVFSLPYKIELEYEGLGGYTVSRTTKIVVVEEKVEFENCVQFENLGGLEEEITCLKRYLKQVVVKKEESFFQIHGILIHGNHGTGKTDLLNGCVHYMKKMGISNVFEINILRFKQFSRNEDELKNIFHSALKIQPSIIVCDEIEKCLTTKTLIRTCGLLLDELYGNNVTMIATTSDVVNVPTSLRRHGRLEKELFLPIPNEIRRKSIIEVLISKRKISTDFTNEIVEYLAERSHGYVGSDLKVLVDRFITELSLRQVSDENKLKFDFFISIAEKTLKMTKPSVIRDVEVSIPKVHWSDIGGQSYLINNLKECIEWKFEHKEEFQRFNLRPPKGVLLYGPPGCSKTLAAKALATECHLNFISVKGPELFSKWVGESEKAVHRLFEKARDASPCILFFDEIDGLAVERGNQNQSAVGDRVLSQLLSELDGIRELEDVVLVAATNRPDLIDPALLRPGRVDRMVYVGPPDLESRIEILNIYIRKMKGNIITQEEVRSCAKDTEGYSGAELCALVREAGYIALFETSITTKTEEVEGEGENKDLVVVSGKHLVEAMKKVRTRISDEMIQFYENFSKKYSKK